MCLLETTIFPLTLKRKLLNLFPFWAKQARHNSRVLLLGDINPLHFSWGSCLQLPNWHNHILQRIFLGLGSALILLTAINYLTQYLQILLTHRLYPWALAWSFLIHVLLWVLIFICFKKVELSLWKIVKAQRVVRRQGSHISRQSAHRWLWGCQPYAPAALYPQEDPWHSFLLEIDSTPGS
jgi:hypothetical protein